MDAFNLHTAVEGIDVRNALSRSFPSRCDVSIHTGFSYGHLLAKRAVRTYDEGDKQVKWGERRYQRPRPRHRRY